MYILCKLYYNTWVANYWYLFKTHLKNFILNKIRHVFKQTKNLLLIKNVEVIGGLNAIKLLNIVLDVVGSIF